MKPRPPPSQSLSGPELIELCTRLKAQGKRIWRLEVVSNGRYLVRGIMSDPSQTEFGFVATIPRATTFPERAAPPIAQEWFRRMKTKTNGGAA